MIGASKPRKWHLTAYFTYADLQSLPTIDNDQNLRSIPVPAGIYKSGKARSRNSDLTLDTSPTGASQSMSSASSSPPSTPMALTSPTTSGSSDRRYAPQGAAPGQPFLPPIHAAIPQDYPRVGTPQREPRCSEDQRMIQMLNRNVR